MPELHIGTEGQVGVLHVIDPEVRVIEATDPAKGWTCYLAQTYDRMRQTWQPTGRMIVPNSPADDGSHDDLVASCAADSVLDQDGAWFFSPLDGTGTIVGVVRDEQLQVQSAGEGLALRAREGRMIAMTLSGSGTHTGIGCSLLGTGISVCRPDA